MSAEFERLAPKARHAPSGYVHGVVVPPGLRTVYVAGQLGSGPDRVIESDDLAIQFATALDNVLTIVREAGGGPHSVATLTAYVIDFDEYRAVRTALAVLWRARFGTRNVAMTIVAVKALIDPRAKVEIQGVAHVP